MSGAAEPDLVIFDCDGVLVDSDRISLRIQVERLADLGLDMAFDDATRDFLGIGMPASLRLIAERIGRPVPQQWVDELDESVRRAFETDLTAVPGIHEALDQIALPTCVASGGSHEKMRYTLTRTNLYARFAGRIYSADEVAHGKPAPDVFLHAAHEMGTRPERCVVVEDSPAGIAAANAAGMRSLGYCALTPRALLADADACFERMDQLPELLGPSR